MSQAMVLAVSTALEVLRYQRGSSFAQYPKAKGLKVYIKSIEVVRNYFNLFVTLLGCIGLAVGGFTLLTFGLVSLGTQPQSQMATALVLVSLMLVAVPCGLFFWLNSEARWLKLARFEELVEELESQPIQKFKLRNKLY